MRPVEPHNTVDIRGMIHGGPARMVPRTGNPGPFEEPPDPQSAPITARPQQTPPKPGPSAEAAANPEHDENSEPQADAYPDPSVIDVLVTKALFHKGCHLPVEIVEAIIEQAEYWPHTTVSLDFSDTDGGDSLPVVGTGPNENEFLLRTLPIGFPNSRHSDLDQHQRMTPFPYELSTEHPLERLQSYVGSPGLTVTNPCRKIVFTITSRDQGWGGELNHHGTFESSYTWFDVGLERFEAQNPPEGVAELSFNALRSVIPATRDLTAEEQANEGALGAQAAGDAGATLPGDLLWRRRRFVHAVIPDEDKLQCNILAGHEDRTYRIEWKATDCVHPESADADELEKQGRGRNTGNGEFVRNLKLGDVVTVWAKARFPGWVNHVRSVKVEVYWAV